MGKKNKNWNLEDDSDDVVLVMDKKTKRRLERQKAKAEQQRQQAIRAAEIEQEEKLPEQLEESDASDDAMSRIACLCQEQNWREAVLVCRRAIEDYKAEGREDMLESLPLALVKLEKSLRRQMVAAFIAGARELLKKEYLLDVGEE